MELPNPIPAIRATLAQARFNGVMPVAWQIDPQWHAAFENQAVTVRTIAVAAGEPMPKLEQPTMGGIPFSVNAYLPEGTAVLIDRDGRIVRILSLK